VSHKPHGRPGLKPSAVLRWPRVLHAPPCHRMAGYMCFSPARAALPCRGRPCGCTLCGRVLVYSYLPKQLWPVGDHPAGVNCADGCVLTAACQSSSGLWGTTLWVYTVRLGAVRNHEYAHSSCAPMCISLVFPVQPHTNTERKHVWSSTGRLANGAEPH